MFPLGRYSLFNVVSRFYSMPRRLLRGNASDFASKMEKCSNEGDLPPIEETAAAVDPYEPEKPKCLFCRYNVELDYKNVRLLSQFVSSFTGRLYEQNVTGLCEHQYQRLKATIIVSRKSGLMAIFNKEPRYYKDPKLFDPMKPIRPNPF